MCCVRMREREVYFGSCRFICLCYWIVGLCLECMCDIVPALFDGCIRNFSNLECVFVYVSGMDWQCFWMVDGHGRSHQRELLIQWCVSIRGYHLNDKSGLCARVVCVCMMEKGGWEWVRWCVCFCVSP